MYNALCFLNNTANRVVLISVALALRLQLTLSDYRYGAVGATESSFGLPVYTSAFTGTHCAYPWRAGQTELA